MGIPDKDLEYIEERMKQIKDYVKEIKLTLSIAQHPNVIKTIGLCMSPFVIVQELADESLLKVIQTLEASGETLPILGLIGFMSDIVAGMKHLHQHGIIHRDLALRNILIMQDGTCKVSDFGLSRRANSENKEKEEKKKRIYQNNKKQKNVKTRKQKCTQ